MRYIAVGIAGILCFGTLGASFAQGRAVRLGATVVELTDTVLVEDTVKFGINLGGDTYYSGAVLTKPFTSECRSCSAIFPSPLRQSGLRSRPSRVRSWPSRPWW